MIYLKNSFHAFCAIGLMCFTQVITSISYGGEFKIRERRLDNGVLWENDISHQGKYGICTSHAVTDCLKYVHGDSRIMPAYLHKHAHHWMGTTTNEEGCAYRACDDYKTGHTIRDLMRFCYYFGVPEVPIGQEFNPDSGLAFPTGTTKHGFRYVYDVYKYEEGHNKVDKIKNALRKYNMPIAFGIMSRRGNKTLFIDNTSEVPNHLLVSCLASGLIVPLPAKKYHAIVAYGYSDQQRGILIKNSWGAYNTSEGKAVLNYDYLNEYSTEAYIGWAWRDYTRDYSESFGSGELDESNRFDTAPSVSQ